MNTNTNIKFSILNFAKYCLHLSNPDRFIWKTFPNRVLNSNCWQSHIIPKEVCERMVNLYKPKFSVNDKILVLFNAELIKEISLNYKNIIYQNIYFITDSESDYKWISNNFKNINILKLNDFNFGGLLEKIKYFKKIFDIVFITPPFDKSIEFKLLLNFSNLFKEMIVLHPSTWILDKKFKCKIFNDIRNTNYLKYIHLFWGNDIFNVKRFSPLCVSYWNTEKTDDICEVKNESNLCQNELFKCKINDVSFFGSKFNRINLFKKFIETTYKNNNFKNNIKNTSELTNFSLKFSPFRGNVGNILFKGIPCYGYKEDFFSLICIDFKKFNYIDSSFKYGGKNSDNEPWRLTFTLNSEDERLNLVKYCKTKVVRFILSLYKSASHLDAGEVYNIPWLDYTKTWDDKKLCEEFQIDKDLWNYINNFIPDYYDDYKSGF